MKLQPICFSTIATGAVVILLLAGCGKEAPEVTVETTPPETTPAAQPAQPAAAIAPAQMQAQDARLRESQAAIVSGEYEKAAAALVAAQQMHLSQQQAELVAKQMQQLQGSLAAAVAGGDPRAKAAADKLRQSATVR